MATYNQITATEKRRAQRKSTSGAEIGCLYPLILLARFLSRPMAYYYYTFRTAWVSSRRKMLMMERKYMSETLDILKIWGISPWHSIANHKWILVFLVLVGKPEGRRTLGRPRRRWMDNIRMDLQDVGRGYMDWIELDQDRDRWRTLVSAVMNFRIPWNAGNFLTSYKQVSFSRRTLYHGLSK